MSAGRTRAYAPERGRSQGENSLETFCVLMHIEKRFLYRIRHIFRISQQFSRNAAYDDEVAVKQVRHRFASSRFEAKYQFFVCHPGKVGFANQSAEVGPGGQRHTLTCHVFRASQPQAVPENSRALATQVCGPCWSENKVSSADQVVFAKLGDGSPETTMVSDEKHTLPAPSAQVRKAPTESRPKI